MRLFYDTRMQLVALVLTLWCCAGCATPLVRSASTASSVAESDADRTSSDAAPATSAEPQPAPEKLEPLVLPQKAQKRAASPQKLYTLQMTDADVREVLLAFAEQSGLDIMIDPRVEGTITIDVKQATLERILSTIVEFANLEYVREGNLVTITVPKLQTRIFRLNYVTSARQGRGSISGSVGGSRSSTQTAAGATESWQTGSGGYNEVTSKNSFDIWEEINAGLAALKSPDGRITIHRSSNTIVVDDYPRSLKKMAEFIASIEQEAQRQVVIEANIIEVLLDKKNESGINWDFIQTLPQMKNFVWGLAGRGISDWTGYPGKTDSGDSSDSSGTADTQAIPGKIRTIRPFSGVFTLGMPGQQIVLTDIMKALSTQGETRLLSSPRISTLNNQPAIIKIAQEDVYFETTRSTTYGETNTETRANFLTVGIVMSVVPQISPDGIITMTIHPSITEKAGEKKSPTGDTVPVVNVRETETVARTPNNQTVLIGGLIQDKIYDDTTGLPVLMHIPYFGKLFRFDKKETKRTELVIMLTPRIITEQDMEQLADSAKQKLEQLRLKK